MKVLIVGITDIGGGAERSTYRLHQGLQKIGINSQMLVKFKKSDDDTVINPAWSDLLIFRKYIIRSKLEDFPIRRYKNRNQNILFKTAWVPFSGMPELINSMNPDIVQLSNISLDMIQVEELAYINKPIVWILHNMWPFTGGCHYDEGCEKYKNSCGKCPALGSNTEKDLSRRVFLRKQKTYSKIKSLTVVGVSSWITECAKKSTLFAGRRVINLPNPIDTNIFSPLEKKIAREILNLPMQKKIILFGADKATSDPRKGFRELSSALKLLKMQNNEIEAAVFGSGRPENAPDLGLLVRYYGYLHDGISLRILYSAADVMVVPSIQDNLPNTVMESLSCGTPVVAFNIGGIPDMVDHQENGYLAKPYDVADLAHGIEWILDHPNPKILSSNAREKVVNCFEMKKVAQQYHALYKEILQNAKKGVV